MRTVLRKLQLKDAPFMLEWMQDEEILACFRFDPSNSSIESCNKFIMSSYSDSERHYAVVDGKDEYQGTISLKNINFTERTAEYAIVLRASACGKGLATIATDAIMHIAYKELGLYKVYLNVFSDNLRAIRFYEKYGFIYQETTHSNVVKDGQLKDLMWFVHLNPCYSS